MERIPKISDDMLEKLALKIKPVVRFMDGVSNPNGELYYIQGVDYHRDLTIRSFVWDPKPIAPARDLVHYKDIKTYHTCDSHVFFKPSIAEVIAQIPENDITTVMAFETLSLGLTSKNCTPDYHHFTTTKLYKKVES